MSHNKKVFEIVFPVQKGKGCFHGCILAFLQLLKQVSFCSYCPPTHRQQWTLLHSSTSSCSRLVYLFPLNLNTFCRTEEHLAPSYCCAPCNMRKQKVVDLLFQRLIFIYHSLMLDATCVVCGNFSFSNSNLISTVQQENLVQGWQFSCECIHVLC